MYFMDFFVDFVEDDRLVIPEESEAILEMLPLSYGNLFEKNAKPQGQHLSIQSLDVLETEPIEEPEFLIIDEVFALAPEPREELEKKPQINPSIIKEERWDYFDDDADILEVITSTEDEVEYREYEITAMDEMQIILDEIESFESISWTELPAEKIETPEPAVNLLLKHASSLSESFANSVLPISQNPTQTQDASEIQLYKGKYKVKISVSEEDKKNYFNEFPNSENPPALSETDSLIEQFLMSEAKISLKGSNRAFTPTQLDSEIAEETEVITETMAKILVLQGKKQEAIK